ncbi:MAG: LLM class F420-dependent oxidoreductase [Deltaproteobacteria bacterium]|nr:LLM class F420-dependent oxidoreductase [Deltaproteobacteria bacterium]MBW2418865.1 LLM class F420-dependent oxidoreductase [Deltaproteobacteria bacterium]
MKFSIHLPTDRVDAPAEFLSARAIAEMAAAAEAAGFDACYVTDHPIPADRWLQSGGHHTLDPFVALACAAAATTRLRLQTHVLVLPYRNPFLSAKAIASLDLLSGGRVIAGVAAGYLEEEFAALGVRLDERNALCDESITTMRRVWSGESVELAGRHWSAPGNTALPRPLQQSPPIWVGGNSRRAMRRAVELGDGWLPFPAPPAAAQRSRTAALENLDDLERRIDELREQAAAAGRTRPLDVCFVPFGMGLNDRDGGLDADRVLESTRELERLGVTWLTIALPGRTRSETCEKVSAFGAEVLSQLD